MQKKTLNILNYIVFTLLAIVLMYFAFRGVKLQELWEGIRDVSFGWVAASVLIGIASYFFRAARWQILIEPIGKRPSFANTYHAVMVGYLANLAVPRIGEITRCGVLHKTDKLPFDQLIGTVVLERVFDVIFLFLALLAAVLIRVDEFGGFLFSNIWQPVSHSLSLLFQKSTAMWVLLLVLISLAVLVSVFRKQLLSLGAVKKVKALVKGFLRGIISGLKMKHRWLFLLYSLLISFCYWMMSYTIMLAIPETAGLTVFDALFLFVIGGIAWVVPVPGGFGAFHLIVPAGLQLLYGIPTDRGIIFATISHESQVLFMLILGIISLIFIALKLKKIPKTANT